MTDREALAAELVSDCAVVRERRYHLLASATVLHASMSSGIDSGRWLAGHHDVRHCVDRAESLLAEIEKREREAGECEQTGSGE